MQRSRTVDTAAHPQKDRSGVTRPPLALLPRLLVLALVALASPAAPDVPDTSYTVTRLSDRVIVVDCRDVNVTAIAADSGLVVIDTNRSPAVMQRLRRAIEEEFGRQDFRYVVNTHGDADHSSGNPAFPSVPLVTHRDYAAFVLHAMASTLRNEWIQTSRLEKARTRYKALDPQSQEAEELRARISTLDSASADQREGRAPRTPAIAFEDSLRLDLGDLTLELRFCGQAHTNHDIVVYVPEEKLLVAGDLICSPQSPCFRINAMADVPRLVRELGGLLQREAGLETVVPGHGKILTRADLSTFCRTVSEQYGKVRPERSAGRIVSQTIDGDGIQAALERCPPPAPGSPGTLDWSEEEFATLGTRLVRRGMVDEAVSVLRLAIRALPGSALLYNRLGDACLEKGDRDAALAAYAKSLALVPGNRYAEDMLKILREGE